VNRCHPHSSFHKRTAEYAGAVTFTNLTKSLDASNIHCQKSWISFASVLGISFSQNLMLVCNTTCLSLRRKVKTSVPLSNHLVPLKTKYKYWQNKLFLQISYFVLNKHFIGPIWLIFVYIKLYCFIIVYLVGVLLRVKLIPYRL
jgi:hypothetical protein